MTPTSAYDELATQRLDSGRGYDKRSVETFRARALDLVDELLRQVKELEDRLVVGGAPTVSEAESDLLVAFRSADSFQRQKVLAVLECPSGLTRSSADETSAPEHQPIATEGLDDCLLSFADAVVPPVDLGSSGGAGPTLRVPLRVTPVDGTARPPTPMAPWRGWVD